MRGCFTNCGCLIVNLKRPVFHQFDWIPKNVSKSPWINVIYGTIYFIWYRIFGNTLSNDIQPAQMRETLHPSLTTIKKSCHLSKICWLNWRGFGCFWLLLLDPLFSCLLSDFFLSHLGLSKVILNVIPCVLHSLIYSFIYESQMREAFRPYLIK